MIQSSKQAVRDAWNENRNVSDETELNKLLEETNKSLFSLKYHVMQVSTDIEQPTHGKVNIRPEHLYDFSQNKQ